MTRLRYVDDTLPGIQRAARGEAFQYFDPAGKRITDKAELQRIASLAVPPAYKKVGICPIENGHLQATGRDARGRKQYRYHPDWRRARDEDKLERMAEFGRMLPTMRRRVANDLRSGRGVPRRTAVLATLARLLDTTLVRVGNERCARENRSFGLTTLLDRHATIRGDRLRLRFKGKSGVLHEVEVNDPLVARMVRRCQALPGQELFQYRNEEDDSLHSIESDHVNEYLRTINGAEITAKDFRTWHGSVLALSLLMAQSPPPKATEVLREVASSLRNTVAVCRKSYVHPQILQACADATDLAQLPEPARRRGVSAAERGLLHFLLGAAAGAKAARGRSGTHKPSKA